MCEANLFPQHLDIDSASPPWTHEAPEFGGQKKAKRQTKQRTARLLSLTLGTKTPHAGRTLHITTFRRLERRLLMIQVLKLTPHAPAQMSLSIGTDLSRDPTRYILLFFYYKTRVHSMFMFMFRYVFFCAVYLLVRRIYTGKNPARNTPGPGLC